jgi:hypothetical protein
MNPRPGSADLVEPAGPTDPEVPVVAIKTKTGRPLALLANYSMHYCGDVGGDDVISADYFGAFCDRIEKLLKADKQQPPFVAMLSNGTSGDCNSTDFRSPPKLEPPFTQIHRVANDVADVAFKVYGQMKFHDWVQLKHAQTELLLGIRPPREDVAIIKTRLSKAPRRNGQLQPWTTAIYDHESVLLSEYPTEVPLILQAFRIGDLAIAAIPCEVFAEIGLELKHKSPFPQTFTIELANGYNGYLPTPAQHKLGGYETWRARSSYLEIGASTKITETIFKLFEQVR